MAYPRVYTSKEQVMQADKNGMVRDHYTGKQIRYADAEKGHMLYYEHRYLDKAADKMNMSKKDFRRMNKASNILIAQDRKNNRGHEFECHDDTIGFNNSLHHIGKYLKYGKSKSQQAAIDKQIQQARLDYLREMRDNGKFNHDRNSSRKINTKRESLLTAEDRINYKMLDSFIAKDKARAAAKKSGNKASPAKSIPIKSIGNSGKAIGIGTGGKGGGIGTGGKGGGIGTGSKGGGIGTGSKGGGGKGGH